jgi:hypothetical protein
VDKQTADNLDECFAAVIASRDAIIPFYDCRFVFASYCEVLGSLAASLIKNDIYTRKNIAHMIATMLADALTRESKTECVRKVGEEIIEGRKQ